MPQPSGKEVPHKVQVGGFLRLADGQVKALQPVWDADWVEGWLRRSVAPATLWSLTSPLLPIAEGLTIPLGGTIPLLGLDVDGGVVAVLLDLRVERPFSQVLGEGLGVLQWAEQLDERQLETFARSFWRDQRASLRGIYEQVVGAPAPSILGNHRKVHLLSWRSWGVLLETQQFLQRHQLAIWLFRLMVAQSLNGEVVALAEPVTVHEALEKVALTVQQMGSGSLFLQALREPSP